VSSSWNTIERFCAKGLVISTVVLAFLFVRVPAFGQSVPSVGTGNLEVGLFGGESYGLDRFRPMGGANVAYGLSPKLFPFVEASYLPGVARQLITPAGTSSATGEGKFDMLDFHGGLHIRFRRPESRVVPYAVVGAGLIHESSGTLLVAESFGSGARYTPGFNVRASTVFAVNFGGGLRFFFNEHLALRVEFKGFKPTSEPRAVALLSGAVAGKLDPHLFYRFAIGPVFQFR
jgi:hypothetical protein